MKFQEVKKRTAEPQNIEYRMSKGGFASLSHFFIKKTVRQKKLTTSRIHSFDTCPPEEDSTFSIRYSLFQSFFLDLTGRSRPEAALNPEPRTLNL